MSWYGIIPAGIPRVTAPQAPGTQRNTLKQTMFFNGFLGIAGTGGIETAMAGHQWTDSVAVNFYQSECEITHWMMGVQKCVSDSLQRS